MRRNFGPTNRNFHFFPIFPFQYFVAAGFTLQRPIVRGASAAITMRCGGFSHRPTIPLMTTPERTELFVQLLTQYQLRVQLFILSLVPNRDDAEEILQETNLVLWRKFDEFQPGGDFRAWAFRVAYNKVKAHYERTGRDRLRFGEKALERLADLAASEQSDGDPTELLELLRQCKEQLSEADLDLITRRYEPGATAASVARQVGRSIAAVYKAVVRIRRTLHDCIERALRRRNHP